MIDDDVRRFAEDPAAWGEDFPADSEWRRVLTDRYCLLFGPIASSTQVSRLRLDPDGVAEALAEVRAAIAAQGHRDASWSIGSSAAPSDLVDRLVTHGLEPDDHLTALVLSHEPPAGTVEARRVRDLAEFRTAMQLTHDVFETPAGRRAEWEADVDTRFAAERSGAGARVYLAFEGGQAVGAASSVVEAGLPAALLVGGAVVPDARGRGVYRSLVRARWDDAVADGFAALCVQARHTSRPILESIGFEPVAEVEVLRDPAT